MRSVLRRSSGMLARAALALLVLGFASGAEARVETLVWEHPNPDEVAGFKLHYGTASGSYTEVLDVGLQPQASDGSFSHDLSVADDLTIYVAVSAYAFDGRASPLSNERVREGIASGGSSDDTGSGGTTDPGTDGSTGSDDSTDSGSGGDGGSGSGGSTDSGGSSGSDGSSDPIATDPNTLWYEDFEASALGTFVAEWVDTAEGNSLVEDDSLFEITSLGGTRVLATSSTATDIHSHHVGSESSGWSSYELRARIRVDDPFGRIGISSHSDYPAEDVYYRLGTAWKTGELEIQSHPWFDQIGVTCPDMGTGVVVQPDTWYRLRLQVEIGTTETHVRAKAWAEGHTEPAGWQAQCSQASPSLPIAGTVGVWSGRAGAKFWDDFEAIGFPADSQTSPDPGPTPLRPPTRPVLIAE